MRTSGEFAREIQFCTCLSSSFRGHFLYQTANGDVVHRDMIGKTKIGLHRVLVQYAGSNICQSACGRMRMTS